ncbi:12476_t:CDS:2 [Cetraspora pellucida]|uniref:12476_t:CDS:1 n=1 Tax=Cetraspora pellucida TaxID=1433469 RepID=A0ACA9LSY9_9GLOM|nr:12476_t:CDS:2 [Cetraspora pellucida]
MKKQLKKMLESDEEYAEQLQKLNVKGVLFNVFWNVKLYSEVKDCEASLQMYKDLYNPSDLDNPNSNIFLSLIVKYVFVSDKEHTQANAVWTQAVLEIIFNEEYLLPKIDADFVNM